MNFGLQAQDIASSVKQMRERLSDLIESDSKFNDEYYLLQWLKRHQFKIDRTETSIREAVEWRKEHNIESLAHVDVYTAFSGLADEFPMDFEAHGKRGQPVFTFNGDGLDAEALIKKYGRDKLLRYIYYAFARVEYLMLQQIQEIKIERANSKLSELILSDNGTDITAGEKIDKKDQNQTDEELVAELMDADSLIGVIIIVTFKGFSVWNAKSRDVISVIFEAAKIAVNYFPVFVRTGYIINMNKVLTMVFKLLKPIITSPAYAIKCFDSDHSKWSAALTEEVDPTELIPIFGGSKVVKA